LIGRGADYDIEIDSISEIVLSRDMKSLKEYVRHGVSRICAQAALRVASGKSYNDAVRFLLKSGANANGFEDSDVAEILKRIRTIEDDVEEDDKDVEDTPFLPRYSLRAKLLNKERVSPLVNAISNAWFRKPDENLETVTLLIDAGADVKSRIRWGRPRPG